MKQTNRLLAVIFGTLALAGCKNGVGILEEEARTTTYVTEDGQKLETCKIELDDGREYYLAVIDSVNYQQAVNLQKEGWVLPRMHGMSSQDEHRHSSNWIKMEEIIGTSLCDPSTDLADGDMNFRIKNHKFRLLGRGSSLRKGKTIYDYWTDTRFLNNTGYYTYGLQYEESVDGNSTDVYTTYFYSTSSDVCHGALLLKDAYLVENEIPDSVYVLPGNKKQIAGKRIHGADGYDYWTVMPVADSMMVWSGAMEYEKDGWMLARFEGKRFGTSSYKFREWEKKTIHAEGHHLTAEGLCGRHPLGTEFGIVDNFDDAMPQFVYITPSWEVAGYWLGTPTSKSNAGIIFHRNNVMQSTHHQMLPLGRVALFKRIQPSIEDAKYRYILPDGNYAQARKVVGKSGAVYYVVDPSGWQGLKYHDRELPNLEKDGFHVLELDELSDMLGVQLEGGSKLPNFQHPLFKSLFPEDVEMLVMSNGQQMWFYPAVKVYSYIEKGLEVIPHSYGRPINVRLVKKVK